MTSAPNVKRKFNIKNNKNNARVLITAAAVLLLILGCVTALASAGRYTKVEISKYELADRYKKPRGWKQIGAYWYHFDSNGVMDTGWTYIYNGWYYFGSDGIRRTGWNKICGEWYNLGENGVRLTGWKYISNGWYHFDENGVRETGWRYIYNGWYHFDENGIRQTGWQKIGGDTYYFNSDGRRRTETLYTKLKKHSFYENGVLRGEELRLTKQTQERSSWCWAASSAMVGEFNTDISKTQTDIVKYIKGSEINEGGYSYEIADAIEYSSGFSKTASVVSPLDYTETVSEINNDRPFVIGILWTNNSRHAVVGAGYDSKRNRVYIIDPAFGVRNQYYDYASLINGTRLASGTGKCDYMITYRED